LSCFVQADRHVGPLHKLALDEDEVLQITVAYLSTLNSPPWQVQVAHLASSTGVANTWRVLKLRSG
jgi:hypothetical protein